MMVTSSSPAVLPLIQLPVKVPHKAEDGLSISAQVPTYVQDQAEILSSWL